jgi:hypothetical protein
MIRRQVGREYWLITQDDHARVSGVLAEGLGNGRFGAPSSAAAVLGIGLHDCGWPMHDQDPTLNPQHQPLDVFESPRHIGLPVWEASARLASEKDPYAGLLVSLHGLALSALATGQSPLSRGSWDLSDPRARFELNRFQHGMIELQERLRGDLGMHIDRPLKLGLSEESDDPLERQLVYDFRWLQAMDQVSLAICCTKPPFESLSPVLPNLRDRAVIIKVQRPSAGLVMLWPWPFARDMVSVDVPFRRLRAERFADESEFRAAYAAAPIERFTVALQAHTI